MDKKLSKQLTSCGSKTSYSKLQLPNGAKSTFAPLPGDNKEASLDKQTTASPQGSKKLRPGPPPPLPPTKPPSLTSRRPVVTSPKCVGGKSQGISPATGTAGNNPASDTDVSLTQTGRAGNDCDDVTCISLNDKKTTETTTATDTAAILKQVISGEACPAANVSVGQVRIGHTATENSTSQTSMCSEGNTKGKVSNAADKNTENSAVNNNKNPSSQADVSGVKSGNSTTGVSCASEAEGYRRKSTPLKSDSGSSSSPRIKYKKTRPAPPPPKPPDAASSKKGGALTKDAVLENKLVKEEKSLNQSDSEARSDLSSNSSLSNSPRLSHKSRLLVGKKPLIVKPSTPPPAPPGESSKQQVVMKTGQLTVEGDSVGDNAGLCARDVDINSSNEDSQHHLDIININNSELGPVGNDQEVSKPQDLQKLGECDKEPEQINTSMEVISGTEKEMQGDKLKTVISNDSGDNNNTGLPATDNSAGSTQTHSNTVVTNTCGSAKPHMRSPIHSQKPKRRKNHFALALCCGLGGIARPESPLELELPMRTEGTLPRGNDVIVRGSDTSDVKLMAGESSRSLTTTGAVILPGAQSESKATTLPKGKHNIFDDLNSSPQSKKFLKVSQTQSCHSLSIEKPVIQDVKLLKSSSKSPMPVRNQNTTHCAEIDDDVFLPVSSQTPLSHKKQIHSPVQATVFVTNPTSLQMEEVKLRTPSKSRTESDLSIKVIPKPRSQSVEDVSCVVVDLDLDTAVDFERNKNYRSSFMSEDIRNSKPALFQNPGEFQTILKHSKEDTEKVYALPQPACYGDSTLKAVKLITEKYDTLQRWKLRAMSFREHTLKNAARLKFQTASTSANQQQTAKEESGDKGNNGGESPQTNGIEITSVQDKQEEIAKGQEALDEVDHSLNPPSSAIISKPQVATTTLTHSQAESPATSYSVKLSKEDMHRIKVFFSSTDTQVAVCGCVADLMLAAMDSSGQPKEWQHQTTGVPVFVLNTGEGRSKRGLRMVLSDRDTGFTLWQDTINYLSQYKEHSPGLHTMHLSSSLMKLVGFKFHDTDAANEFLKQFREITQNTNDELWKVSRGEKRKVVKKSKHKAKVYTPVKGDISQPLQFEHVTNIDSRNPDLLRNIGSLMPKGSEGGNSEPEEVYRTRANSG